MSLTVVNLVKAQTGTSRESKTANSVPSLRDSSKMGAGKLDLTTQLDQTACQKVVRKQLEAEEVVELLDVAGQEVEDDVQEEETREQVVVERQEVEMEHVGEEEEEKVELQVLQEKVNLVRDGGKKRCQEK